MRAFIFTVTFVLSAWAQAEFKVDKVSGKVKIGEKAVSKGQTLEAGAKVDSADPQAVLQIKDGETMILLKGEFQYQIPSASDALSRLIAGKIRVHVPRNLNSKSKAPKFRVSTPAAVAGVRGTDFFVSYSPALNESEVVCFESEIDFSANDKSSKAVVKEGQWGGLGGRFGKKIAPPLTLPQAVMDSFRTSMRFQ